MVQYFDDPDYNPRIGAGRTGRVRKEDFSIGGKSWEYRNPYNQRLIDRQNQYTRRPTSINENSLAITNPLYDYGYGRVRDAAAALQIGNVSKQEEVDKILNYLRNPQGVQQTEETAAAPVEEPKTGFTPTYLDTGSNPALFINRFGGNKETMAHSGLKAVKAAEAAGLSISEIQRMGREQGISFGSGAQEYFKQKQGPSAEDMFASQIKTLQDTFAATLKQQGDRFREMQRAQEERMEALQQQMRQSAIAQQRPTVAGVKMAEGTGGTAMQIARRGIGGAFGRRGMRISGLNV